MSLPRTASYITQILFAFAVICIVVSCGPANRETSSKSKASANNELIIFHAGSLSAPFNKISRQFEAEHPGVQVKLEAAGSVDCARKITELHKPCDLMASSDYKVIEKFLIPGHAAWHIPFAANEMVIAYTERSRGSGNIRLADWTSTLLDTDIRFARSDPDSDPCGYRTLMVFQLAENYYDDPGLSATLEGKDKRYIRPKEVDLIALLEVGEVDFIFIYRSVAMQHHLKYLELPDELNLKNPGLSGLYRNTAVKIAGNHPGDSIIIRGEPMVYSITLLGGAPNPALAADFLDFLLDTGRGMKVMEEMGQQSVIPSQSPYYEKVPERFRKYVTQQTIALNP